MDDKPLVLLIDDDQSVVMGWYEKVLQRQFRVQRFTSPDKALHFIRDNAGTIRGVVLDVMMTHGGEFTGKETEEGLQTGIALLKRIQPLLNQIPVVILTNVNPTWVAEKVSGLSEGQILRKAEYNPTELARRLDSLVSAADDAMERNG